MNITINAQGAVGAELVMAAVGPSVSLRCWRGRFGPQDLDARRPEAQIALLEPPTMLADKPGQLAGQFGRQDRAAPA
jgi:hypothetical protein